MGKRPSDTEHSHDEHPEVIARSARGEVRRCSDCGSLHLRFGNAILALNAEDLPTLRAAVENSPRRQKANGDPASGRCVELFLGESGPGFAFDTEELIELDLLLETTSRRVASIADPIANPILDFSTDPITELLRELNADLPRAIVNRLGGKPNARS
jgi:hypothetical protein